MEQKGIQHKIQIEKIKNRFEPFEGKNKTYKK